MTEYEVVVRRDGPLWVATATGDDLPRDGVTAKSRLLAELRDLILLRLLEQVGGPASSSAEWSYDLPLAGDVGLDAFWESFAAAGKAQEEHAELARQVASGLVSEHHATVQDVAAILHLSYLEAAQLLADRPRPVELLHFAGSARHFWSQDVPRWLGWAAGQQARTLRVISSDDWRSALDSYLASRRDGLQAAASQAVAVALPVVLLAAYRRRRHPALAWAAAACIAADAGAAVHWYRIAHAPVVDDPLMEIG